MIFIFISGEQSRFAVTANNLQNLNSEEKLKWALEVKKEANLLFAQKRFSEAADKYFEAVAASELESESVSGNIDELVVPVLCNLAACSIELQVLPVVCIFSLF